MAQYLLLIQGNAKSPAGADEWSAFLALAKESGMFRGGSALGGRTVVGDAHSAGSSAHIVGFMRFDSDDKNAVVQLLKQHPVVAHGGSVELCEMPPS